MTALGCWKSNGVEFDDKINALVHASATGGSVTFHYFDHVWDNINNFKTEKSLQELYRDRALQLRNTYDYLILNYSAGADSDNIFKAFVDNNIKLDRIYVKWPIKILDTHKVTNDVQGRNLLSEWELTIHPKLEFIKQHYPDIEIFVHDWSTNVGTLTLDQFNKYPCLHSLGDIARFSTQCNDLPKTLKVANIYGIDKPIPYFNNGAIGFCFRDETLYVGFGTNNIISEPFYWSPEFPEILNKQMETVCKAVKSDLSLLKNIPSNEWSGSQAEIESLRTFLNKLIYKSTETVFQVNKSLFEYKKDWDYWIYESGVYTEELETWNKLLKTRLETVDNKFLKNGYIQPMRTKVFWYDNIY